VLGTTTSYNLPPEYSTTTS